MLHAHTQVHVTYIDTSTMLHVHILIFLTSIVGTMVSDLFSFFENELERVSEYKHISGYYGNNRFLIIQTYQWVLCEFS